jgi:DNA-3-methyladenine glycosylase I
MGVLVYDDTTLFEFYFWNLSSRPSWISWTREKISAAFDHFDYKKIKQYNDDKIQDLLQDAGIIRNKLKVIRQLPTHKISLKSKKNLEVFQIHLGFVNTHH